MARIGYKFEDGLGIMSLNRGDKTIALAGERLDVAGLIGRVVQDLAEFVDGAVEAMVEVTTGDTRPELALEFQAADKFAWLIEKDGEDTEGLALKSDE